MKDTKTCFDEKIGEQPDLACEEEDSLFFQSIELTNLSVLHLQGRRNLKAGGPEFG